MKLTRGSRLQPLGRHSASSRGQALVEFALLIPIFFALVFGLIDMGRLIYLNTTLSQAAREAARLASVEASWLGSSNSSCNTVGGPVCPGNVAALRANALTAGNRMMVPFGSIQSGDLFISCDASSPPSGEWTTQTCTSKKSGSLVSIRVVYVFTAITPVISNLIGPIDLTSSATMGIN